MLCVFNVNNNFKKNLDSHCNMMKLNRNNETESAGDKDNLKAEDAIKMSSNYRL